MNNSRKIQGKKREERQQNDCAVCEIYNPHEKIIELLKNKDLNEEKTKRLADLFQVLSDPTRLKIINALRQQELCVCDIQEILQMSASAVSHQLRVLRNFNLVKYRKEGRQAFYSIADQHVISLFCQGLEHVMED